MTGMNRNLDSVLSDFGLVRRGRTALLVRRGWEGLADQGMAAPEAFFKSPEARRLAARGRAVSVPTPGGGGKRMVVRACAHGGLAGRVNRYLFLGSRRPLRELANCVRAERGGLRTARALAVVQERVAGPLYRSYLVSEEVEGAEDAACFAARLKHGIRRGERAALRMKRAVIRAAGRAVRHMHGLGLVHGDLNVRNLLVQVSPQAEATVWIIDFDKSRLVARAGPRQRYGNLARLARSVRKVRPAAECFTRTDGLRFLHAYLGRGKEQRALLRCWFARLRKSGALHAVWWRLARVERDAGPGRAGRRETAPLPDAEPRNGGP